MNYANRRINAALKAIKEGKNVQSVLVRGVPPNVVLELHNIADNIGTDFSAFMKSEFRKILDSYPEKYKQKPLNH